MKRLICIFTAVLAAGFAEAQFSDLGVTVSSDGTLTYPAAAVFRSKNDIAAKSDIPQIKTLTLGEGLLGTSYNGSAAVSTGIDISWLLQKRKSYQQDFRLFIDTQPSPDNNAAIGKMQWWSDCEIKCIDKWGNLVYFTSTIALNNSQVLQLHPQITDKTPKIYFWRGDLKNPAGGCWGVRGQLTNFNSSIGANGSYGYSAIWIYPSLSSTEERALPVFKGLGVLDAANYPKKGKGDNSSAANLAAGYKWVVWGEYVRSVLNNPDNTVLCWRQTKTEGEIFNSRKLWRPVRIEFYGDFKEVKP